MSVAADLQEQAGRAVHSGEHDRQRIVTARIGQCLSDGPVEVAPLFLVVTSRRPGEATGDGPAVPPEDVGRQREAIGDHFDDVVADRLEQAGRAIRYDEQPVAGLRRRPWTRNRVAGVAPTVTASATGNGNRCVSPAPT